MISVTLPRRIGPMAITLAILILPRWVEGATKAPRVHVVEDNATKTPRVHVVGDGQSLARIAKRYSVSVDAICRANGLSRANLIQPKQQLVIPESQSSKLKTSTQRQGKLAQSAKSLPGKAQPAARPSKPTGRASNATSSETWRKYVRPAPRPGYVDLRGTGRSWKGYAIVRGNQISVAGARGFKRALASWRTGASEDVDPRLIRLLTETSDLFGGRPLRIVGGYRENSYAQESKHKTGRAVDFEVVGVPNEVLRDYLRTLKDVGVGYYPNSSFVHLDVRKKRGYWVDESRPGQPPVYRYRAVDKTVAKTSSPSR